MDLDKEQPSIPAMITLRRMAVVDDGYREFEETERECCQEADKNTPCRLVREAAQRWEQGVQNTIIGLVEPGERRGVCFIGMVWSPLCIGSSMLLRPFSALPGRVLNRAGKAWLDNVTGLSSDAPSMGVPPLLDLSIQGGRLAMMLVLMSRVLSW